MTFLFASHSVWWFFIRQSWEKNPKRPSLHSGNKQGKKKLCGGGSWIKEGWKKKENWKAERKKPHFSVNFDSANVDTDAKLLLTQGFRTESFIDLLLSS